MKVIKRKYKENCIASIFFEVIQFSLYHINKKFFLSFFFLFSFYSKFYCQIFVSENTIFSDENNSTKYIDSVNFVTNTNIDDSTLFVSKDAYIYSENTSLFIKTIDERKKIRKDIKHSVSSYKKQVYSLTKRKYTRIGKKSFVFAISKSKSFMGLVIYKSIFFISTSNLKFLKEKIKLYKYNSKLATIKNREKNDFYCTVNDLLFFVSFKHYTRPPPFMFIT